MKSAQLLELEIQKHLVAFVLKHVVMGLIQKGKLPRLSKLFKFVKKLSVKVGWAIAIIPVCKMVDNKNLSVTVAFSLLILTRKLKELTLKLVPKLRRSVSHFMTQAIGHCRKEPSTDGQILQTRPFLSCKRIICASNSNAREYVEKGEKVKESKVWGLDKDPPPWLLINLF